MNKIKKNAIFGLVCFCFLSQLTTVFAQVENFEISGAKPGFVDTLALQTSQKIVKESMGILEKEIDPDKYLLGPGDILNIAIISAKTRQLQVAISPDGRLMIPDVGVINLKGLTLSQGEKAIKDKIAKTFKTNEIHIILEDVRKFKVSLSGAVKKSGIVTATAVDRVSEIVEKTGGITPDGSVRRIQLHRDNNTTPINVDLLKYYKIGNDEANPYVLGGDRIIVPNINEKHTIAIRGDVPFPGEYEFVPGDSLSTLIRIANGFFESSYLDSVELVRFNEAQNVNRYYLDLNSWRNSINSFKRLEGDFPLLSGDRVYIRKRPDIKNPNEVIIQGEIMLPGKYAVDGITTRVSDIILKAGGLTEYGSLEASYLIRQEEMGVEDKEMERLRRIPPGEMSESEYKYFQARLNERQGVMAISFQSLMDNPNSDDNIVLIDRDSIIISQKKYFVNVQGRVNNPGLVVFKNDFNYLDYINSAGGYGFRADESATLIVKSKGQQFQADSRNYRIDPGDYILVPPKQEFSWGNFAMTTLTVFAQIVAIAGVVIAVSRTN